MTKRYRTTDAAVTAFNAGIAVLDNGTYRPIEELTRPQLMQACSVYFGALRNWRDYTKDELATALTIGALPSVKEPKPKEVEGKWIYSKFAGSCKSCGGSFRAGDRIFWVPATKKSYCVNCGTLIESGKLSITGETPKVNPYQPHPDDEPKSDATSTIDTKEVEHIAERVAHKVFDETSKDIAEGVATAVKITLLETADKLRTDLMGEIKTQIDSLMPRPVEVTRQDATKVIIKLAHERFEFVLKIAGLRKNAYLVGPAGTGKSTIGAQVAEALGLPFYTTSCFPQMSPVNLFGYKDAHGQYHRTDFRDAYENGGVFVLDEIDNGHSSTLAGLNQATSNGHCGFPDTVVRKHADFILIATANTYGSGPTRQYVGRNPLDAATLDRFKRVTIEVDEKLESAAAHAKNDDIEQVNDWLDRVRRYRRNAESHGLTVIVSPRMSIDGAEMLAAGFTVAEIEAMTLFDGLADDVKRKLRQ